MDREPTAPTHEGGLALTVLGVAVPAARTRLGGVRWIDQKDRHARPRCFVGQKQAQLREGPGVPLVSLLASNRDPALPDAGQVFQGECLARYGGLGPPGLANRVIHVLHPPPLPTAHLLEAALGRAGADSLPRGAA